MTEYIQSSEDWFFVRFSGDVAGEDLQIQSLAQIYQDSKLEGVLEQNVKVFSVTDKLVCWAMMFNKSGS